MKKVLVILTIVMAVALTGCFSSTKSEDSALEKSTANNVEFVRTGDEAIDTSLIYLNKGELAAFGLIKGEDTSVKRGNLNENSVYVYGPLHDRRVVKGKRAAVTFFGVSGTSYRLHYGFNNKVLTTYQNFVGNNGRSDIFINVPATANGFYFEIVDTVNKVVDNNKGQLYTAKVYDRIVSASFESSKIIINYASTDASSNTGLHYGWNNWTNIKDVAMTYKAGIVSNYSNPGDYATVSIDVPNSAAYSYINFVFKNGTKYDNNNGKNYGYNVRPFISIGEAEYYYNVDSKINHKTITIGYSNVQLDSSYYYPLYIRYGYDNWSYIFDSVQKNNSVEQNMSYAQYTNSWYASIEVPFTAKEINFAVRNSSNVWDNNSGKNYNINIDTMEFRQ